jgi:putative transposase
VTAVTRHRLSIALASRTFGLRETCYRCARKLDSENERIAGMLLGLIEARRNWDSGLGFLYLRKVKGYVWNYKSVSRIYRELVLNLLFRPKKRLKLDKPEELSVPA